MIFYLKNKINIPILYLKKIGISLFKSYDDIDDIFQEIKKLDEKNISIKKQNDNILLKITLLNQFSSEIILYNNKNNINNSIPELEELKKDKIINENNNIKIANNNLEERIRKLEYLYNDITK